MAIESPGSSSFRTVPSVALMIPAPIRTTSGVSVCVGIRRPSGSGFRRAGFEGKRGAGGIDHIGAPPGLLADQLPAMAGARIVLGQQYVAGADGEALPAFGLEF